MFYRSRTRFHDNNVQKGALNFQRAFLKVFDRVKTVALWSTKKDHQGLRFRWYKDYIPEKLADSYEENHNTIVVYWGSPNAKELFPSDTCVDINDFKSIKDLAQYLIGITSSGLNCISFLNPKHKYSVNQPHSSSSLYEWLDPISNINQVHTKRYFNKWFRENKCENIQGRIIFVYYLWYDCLVILYTMQQQNEGRFHTLTYQY